MQHPAVIPHHWLLSHLTIISLLWHLLLNQALKCRYVIIPSHTSLKLLVLLRIMSLFKGTLSFLIFMIHTIINMSIIPTNIPFHLQQYLIHLNVPFSQFTNSHWIPMLTQPTMVLLFITHTILLINLHPSHYHINSLCMASSAQISQIALFQIIRKHF